MEHTDELRRRIAELESENALLKRMVGRLCGLPDGEPPDAWLADLAERLDVLGARPQDDSSAP